MTSGSAGSKCGRFVAGALGFFLLCAETHAQQPLQITPPPPATPATAVAPEAAKGARQEELERVQAEQKKNAEIAAKLKAELDAVGEDRRKLNALLIGSAANIRAVEDRIAAAETRLASLQDNENTVRRSLNSRRAVIGEV